MTSGKFNASSTYKAQIVLTSTAGYKFPAAGLTPAVNTGTAAAGTVSGGDVTGNTLTFVVTFPATAAPAVHVAFQGLTADGTPGAVTTTMLTVTLDQDVDLAWADVTLTGANLDGVTDNNDGTYTLWISSITAANGANVSVALAKTGYTFTPASMNVAIVKAPPTVLPTNGSFADWDADAGQIAGTIQWMAPFPATGITGYKIYWGSDDHTILMGTSAIQTTNSTLDASLTIDENTALPAGAYYFLIYSYNDAGNSADCLAIPIIDG